MEGNQTILASYQAMYDHYTSKFDELIEADSSRFAFDLIALLDIRNALFIDATDNEHLTLADFS